MTRKNGPTGVPSPAPVENINGLRLNMPDSRSVAPLKIALTYVLVAALYIAVSDELAASLARTHEALKMVSLLKGWGFVVVTGIVLYFMVRRHVAAQQRIQKSLIDSSERLALITATTPVFLFEIDPTGTIHHATKSFQGTFSPNIIGSNFLSLIPEGERTTVAELVQSAFATSTQKSLEYTTDADGAEPRTFSLTISPLHRANGLQHLLVTAYDITQLRNVEEQARFQAHLLGAVGQAVIVTDNEGTVLYWNNAAETIYGWPAAEVMGRNILDIAPAPALRSATPSIWAHLKKGERWSGEFLARRKDGSSFPALVTIAPITNNKGKVTGVIGISMDITEQKQTEEALRQSHQRFELVSRASNDTIWDWDIAANKLWMSESFFTKYGYKKCENVSLEEWEKLIHPEDRERILKSRRNAIEQKAESWREEYRFLHAGGSTSYVVDRGFLLYDENGTPVRMVGSMVDVTTLKLAELDQRYLAEERQKLLDQLRLQFERMPIGYMLLDAKFRITEWNPSCERIFGFTRAEAMGRSPFDLIVPSSLQSFVDEFTERLKTGKETLTVIIENVAKDGHTVLCEWYDTPLYDDQGNYTGLMAMVQDITERRLAEEELRKSNIQLRNLSAYLQSVREQERKHIAREIHDELGQELTALKMQAAIIQKAIAKLEAMAPKAELLELTGSLASMADTSIKTVRRIATELRPDVLDKVGLIDALKWQAQEFEKRTGVQCLFVSRIDEWNFPDEVATALFRIFQEALTNVSRHAAATRVAAELSLREGWVEFRVEDNGRGITQEQVDNTSSLGLLGLVERARLLGGTATIVGAPGRGTTIRVQIPLPHQTHSNEP
jgi:PAS domain S-box-containing protein